MGVLHEVCEKERLTLPDELAARIAKASGRNLRRAILALEECKVAQYPFNPSMPCLLYTSPSPRDRTRSRMPSSA